jgi:hypothetical protein
VRWLILTTPNALASSQVPPPTPLELLELLELLLAPEPADAPSPPEPAPSITVLPPQASGKTPSVTTTPMYAANLMRRS